MEVGVDGILGEVEEQDVVVLGEVGFVDGVVIDFGSVDSVNEVQVCGGVVSGDSELVVVVVDEGGSYG